MKLTLIFILFALFPLDSPARAQSVEVVITENTVNALLAAVGPVTGKGKGAKAINYTWVVTHPMVSFSPGAAAFRANIVVKAGGITLKDVVKGKLEVKYNAGANKVTMQVIEARFPITIKLLGARIKVATVDISKYYKPKIEFNGPEPVQKELSMDVGGGKTRLITIAASAHKVEVIQDALRVTVSLAFAGRSAG